MRSPFRKLCTLASLTMLLAAAAPAGAHYGVPRAFGIVFGPGGHDDILLRSDVWGIMHSVDGGKTWQWTCAEPYGGDSAVTDHRPMTILPGGRVLVASLFEGARVTDDFCSWRQLSDFGSKPVWDLSRSGGDVLVLTTTTIDGGVVSLVKKSSDRGDSWASLGTALPTNFVAESLAAAPSDAKRIYVSGAMANASQGTLQRSDDGGATWKGFDFAVDADKTVATMRLALVHPTRPDVVFVWVDMIEPFGANVPDEIVATKDGGATWIRLLTGLGDLPGLAVSPDGTTLVLGGPADGLQSANLDDALANGATAFHSVYPGIPPGGAGGGVWGLNWVDDGTPNGALYAGTNNFGAPGDGTVTLAVSTDGGQSFKPLMSVCEVQKPACASMTTAANECKDLWDTGTFGFSVDFVQGPSCTAANTGGGGGGGTAGTIAGGAAGTLTSGGASGAGTAGGGGGGAAGGGTAGSATSSAESSCGCRTPAPASSARDRAWVALLVAIVVLRRQRTRLGARC